MARIILFLLLPLMLFGQKVKWQDLTPAVKDSIATKTIVGDTADILRTYTDTKVASYYNYYDYQDASINSELQMLVRRAHYLFEKYYDDSDAALHFDYDETSSDYHVDRRSLCRYMKLLQGLHETTGNDIYLDKLLELYNAIDTYGDTLVYDADSTISCRSVVINPDAGSEYAFAHHDTEYHLAGYYLDQQLGGTSRTDDMKDFANVWYSRMNRSISGEPGWGWPYKYYSDVSTDSRVNVSCPAITFFAKWYNDGLSSDSVSTALADSIVDSTYYFVNNQWVQDAGSDSGGWKLRESASEIDLDYTFANAFLIHEAIEEYADTSVLGDWSDKMQRLVNLYTFPSGANNIDGQSHIIGAPAVMVKWFEQDGITTGRDAYRANAWVKSWITGSAFAGETPGTITSAHSPREYLMWMFDEVGIAVKYLNSATWNNDFTQYANSSWETNATVWVFSDGFYVAQKYWLGTGEGYTGFIGYYTNDSSPACPAEAGWSRSGDIVSISYPSQSGSGLTYTYKHRMGSDVSLVIPSSADSLDFTLPDNDSAHYVFYYDTDFVLQVDSSGNLNSGDSIIVMGNRGIYIDNNESRRGYGMIFDAGATTFKYTGNSAGINTDWFRSHSTVDSVYIFEIYHDFSHGLVYDLGLATAKTAIADFFSYAQKIIDNGIEYEGILEDKTQ